MRNITLSIKLVVCIALITLLMQLDSVQASNVKYKNEFAVICKSYSHDIEKSLLMYQSVQKHFENGKYPFYVIVPSKEIDMFVQRFKQENIKIPVFMSEESIFKNCNIPEWKIANLRKHPTRAGWMLQQVVKLCFYQTHLAQDYISFDSDIIFYKDFTRDMFYNNGILKTVATKFKNDSTARKKLHKMNSPDFEEGSRYRIYSYIKYLTGTRDDPWYNFVHGFGLWSSYILNDMFNFFQNKSWDAADLVNMVPWEMQWYGQYIETKYPNKLYPFNGEEFLTIIADSVTKEKNKNYINCIPSHGRPWTYGILNQHSNDLIYQGGNSFYCKTVNFLQNIKYKIRKIMNNTKDT